MVLATRHRYVVTDPDILSGEPIIEGARTPVRAIVELWRPGTPAEEVPAHLTHLNLAPVSYTHLDVYKRQGQTDRARGPARRESR